MDQVEQSNYKIGAIYKRSKILKSWNKRSIVLNYLKGNLSLRKGKHSKEKIILLENYEVSWVGQSKKSKAVKDIASQKYKRMFIGDTNEENARLWMSEIEKIIDKKFIIQQQTGNTPYQLSQKQRELSMSGNEQKKQQVYQTKNGLLGVPVVPGPSQFNNGQQVRPPHSGAFMNATSDKSNQILLNGKNQQPGQGRQVLNVNEEDFDDDLRKQFESCCQYGEDNYNEYDEKKPEDKIVSIPNFNDIYNVSFMPDTIQDNSGIEAIYNSAPESIKEDVQTILEGYYKNKKSFLQGLISKQDSQELQENIHKKNDYYYFVYQISDMKPVEIYEEIQTPSTNEHWNNVIGNYSIQPENDMNTDTRNLSLIYFNFKYEKSENSQIIEKEFVSYRYSIQFANGYFIWEFLHKTKKIDQSIEEKQYDKMTNQIFILPDNQRQNASYLIIKSKFNFKNENQKQQEINIQRFLKGFENINKVVQPDKDIIVECNAEQEDGDDPDDVDSQLFISVRIDRKKNTINEYLMINQIIIDQSQQEMLKMILLVNKQIQYQKRLEMVNTQMSAQRQSMKEEQFQNQKMFLKKIGIYSVVKTTKEKGHYCWRHDYRRDEKKGGLTYHNEKLMKEQKAVIMSMIKRIGSNLLNGRSIMSISMPVEVFDSKTMIQRLAKGFGHAPNFLEKGGLVNSTLEQIKYSAAFLLSSFIMGFNQEKPFNPILGETVQARLNGCPIYFEQTAHHPPTSHYYLYGRGYDLYGCHIPQVAMGANSLTGLLGGNPIIHFKNTGNKVYALWNSFTVFNTAFGQRSLNCFGRAYVWEPNSNLCLELIYNPNSTSGLSSLFSKKSVIDEVSGSIYRVKPEVIKNLQDAHKSNSKKGDMALDPNKDILSLVTKAEGIWCKYLEFDGIRYWDDSKDFPYVCEYEINPLPSDSRYRFDLLYFQKNDRKQSQNQKELMEEAQRYDQKLRELGKKQKKNN